MITKIRNNFKDSGSKFILWLMVISMIAFFIPNIFRRGGEGHLATIAQVNGKSIDLIDFERRVYHETERLNMFRMQFGAQADLYLKALGMDDPKTLALNSLIQESLLNGLVKALGIHISPDFIAAKLQDPSYIYEELSDIIPYAAIDQQGLNITLVNRYLAHNRLSMQDFEDMIEKKVERSLALSLVSNGAYVSNKALKDYYIQNYLAKEYSIVTFPLDVYTKRVQTQTTQDQDVSAFFEKEHKKYWTQEKRSGKQWKFLPKDYGIVVTQSDIESYYNHHKSQFIETPLQIQVRRILFKITGNDEKSALEAQKKAEMVRKDLESNPFQFEELARKNSDDKASAAQGGLLPIFKKGEMDDELERAAFRLQRDGDISGIVPTKDGLEIIQRVTRIPASYKSVAQVENTLKENVLIQKFKTQFAEDIAKIIGVQAKDKQKEAFQKLIHDKKAVQAAITDMANDGSPFAEKLFKTKLNDWFYLTSHDSGILATVESIQKSQKPDLQAVKKHVEQDMHSLNALAALQKDLDSAQSKTESELQKIYPFVTIKSTGFIKKDDKEKIQELAQGGIPVSAFESLNAVGDETSLVHGDKGYIIKLSASEPFNQDGFDARKGIIASLLYDEQKQLVQRGYVASLYRNATIKITESLVTLKDENSL
jgi:parvulin-like peptidyl-prolyl isomerase